MFDLARIYRSIAPNLPAADQLALANWALGVIDDAIARGDRAGLPGDHGRWEVKRAIEAFIDALSGGAALLVEEGGPGSDDTRDLKALAGRACVELNAVLEGASVEERNTVLGNLYDQAAIYGKAVAEGAEVVGGAVWTGTKWLIVGAVAVAALVYSPELKALLGRIFK